MFPKKQETQCLFSRRKIPEETSNINAPITAAILNMEEMYTTFTDSDYISNAESLFSTYTVHEI